MNSTEIREMMLYREANDNRRNKEGDVVQRSEWLTVILDLDLNQKEK